jgi:uncharacterized membrane protein (DUF4010 family)
MLIRDILIIVLTIKKFEWELIKIPTSMLVISLFWFSYLWWINKNRKTKEKVNLEEKSPFEILPALKFAAIFVAILFLIYFIKEKFGDEFVYLTTIIVALIDTETIILPALESLHTKSFDLNLVANIISISIVVNTLIKLFYIWVFAKREYFYKSLLLVLSISLLPLLLFLI